MRGKASKWIRRLQRRIDPLGYKVWAHRRFGGDIGPFSFRDRWAYARLNTQWGPGVIGMPNGHDDNDWRFPGRNEFFNRKPTPSVRQELAEFDRTSAQ